MDYNKEYQRWTDCKDLDPSLKAELLSMNEKEKEDAFYMNLEFGTAGMRGILGAGTNRMNIYTIRKANVGFAKYVLGLPEGKERGVAIGYDNRHMSYKFAIESAKVLATYGLSLIHILWMMELFLHTMIMFMEFLIKAVLVMFMI